MYFSWISAVKVIEHFGVVNVHFTKTVQTVLSPQKFDVHDSLQSIRNNYICWKTIVDHLRGLDLCCLAVNKQIDTILACYCGFDVWRSLLTQASIEAVLFYLLFHDSFVTPSKHWCQWGLKRALLTKNEHHT